jgi:AcrR family transcriptional regulator
MDVSVGLRARKRIAMRQHISDVATALFLARGFDAVTVAEVAEAANVSKMTVFNYFPRKEDLLFDRGPEAATLITNAIRQRPPGQRPMEALQQLLLELIAQRHPLAALGDTFAPFWRLVLASTALQARAREAIEEAEDLLTGLLAEAQGVPPTDPRPRLAAALAIAAYRVAYLTTARRLLAGEAADAIAADHERLVKTAFEALDRALE